MSDYTRRKGERRALESGDSRDEVDYLVRISTDRVFGAEHYQRARELVNEPHLDSDHKETLCRLVRTHDKDNSFEHLSDEDLVCAMPIINYFLDNGHSIYSTKESTDYQIHPKGPVIVVKGDFNMTIGENWDQFTPGDIDEVVSDFKESFGAPHDSYLRPSMVTNKEEMDKTCIIYRTMNIVLNYNSKKFRIEFLDNGVFDSINNKMCRAEFEAAQEHLNDLDSNNDTQSLDPIVSEGEQDSDEENIDEDLFF